MSIEEKEELFHAMKVIIVETVDNAVNSSVKKAVDKAVTKLIGETIDNKIEKAIAPLRQDISELKQETVGLKQDTVELKQEMVGLKQDTVELKQEMVGLKQETLRLNQEMIELKQMIIPSMQKEIRNISRAVAVIEVEHGKKLDILFEAFTINSENIEKDERRICFCEKKIEQHDGEIYYLKSNLNKV